MKKKKQYKQQRNDNVLECYKNEKTKLFRTCMLNLYRMTNVHVTQGRLLGLHPI